jgi:nucleotide-binding universal stress UspA family protein
MAITTITTHVEPTAGAALEAGFAAPFALAEAHGARLTALVFPAETAQAEAAEPGWDLARAEEAAAERLRESAARRGIACETRTRSSFAYGVGEVMADHMRVSDLGLLTLQGAPAAGQRMLIGAALFDSGRPLLLVPAGLAPSVPPSRVVVAWDATPAAVRAVHGALPFIRAAAETLVVTVTDDKELRLGQSGIEMAHLLARHGARASFVSLKRSGGVLGTLVAAAREAPGGLLVMGAIRHSPLRNMVFGSATSDLLQSGPSAATLLAA